MTDDEDRENHGGINGAARRSTNKKMSNKKANTEVSPEPFPAIHGSSTTGGIAPLIDMEDEEDRFLRELEQENKILEEELKNI